MFEPLAGIVLAAGMSTRMGCNKLLLELGGEPVVRRSVRRVLDAGLSPVMVVVGHEAEQVIDAIGDLAGRCTIVSNPDFARGANSSLRAGIAALSPAVPAALVVLADMPRVTSAMLERMSEEYRTHAVPLVVSSYDGVSAPPMLFDRQLFPELQQAEGEGCGRSVVQRHRASGRVLTWPAEALQDLDGPDDYERAKVDGAP